MKFITNRIQTGKSKTFEEIVEQYRSKKEVVKTASTKVAESEKDEADSSGQLDVEPLHQTGESTTMPKNGPSAKKEGDTTAVAGPSGQEDDEGKDSGQPAAEGKLTNNPEKPTDKEAGTKGVCSKCGKPNFLCGGKCSGEEKDSDDDKKDDDSKDKDDDSKDKDDDKEAKVEGKVEKEAARTCETCNKDCGECECEKCNCKPCTAAREANLLKESQCNETEKKEKEKEKEEKEAQCNNTEKKEKKDDEEEEKEAKVENKKFIRLANLDGKTKNWLSDYWKKIYPPEYVDAMLAEK